MRNNYVRKYLTDQQHKVNQDVLSANGERRLGADGWLRPPMKTRPFTADVEQNRFFGADASQAVAAPNGGPASYSNPYIIQVSNASAAVVSDFDLWGAIIYLNTTTYPFNSDGSQTRGAITLSTPYPAPVTYYNMLQQSNTGVFTVGWTHIEMISGTNAQVNLPWTLKTFDMNSQFARRSLPNPTPGNQFTQSVKDNFSQYDMDGSTSLSLNILGSVVFLMYFYPLANINISRSLTGQNAAKTFAPPPSNLPPQPVLISQ